MDRKIEAVLVIFLLIFTGFESRNEGFSKGKIKGKEEMLQLCKQKLGKDSALISEIKYK